MVQRSVTGSESWSVTNRSVEILTGRLDGVSIRQPAREVGGDLFGAFAVDNDRLVLVMGDVSGKGIPASLFMVRAGALVRLLARQIQDPERILEVLNDELSVDNPSGMFVTLICAVFQPFTGRLSIANGGHTPPVLLRPGEDSIHVLEQHGRADLMRYRKDVFDDKYARLRGDRPCKTIVAHLAKEVVQAAVNPQLLEARTG